MTVRVDNLLTLPAEKVAEETALHAQLLQEAVPTIDVRRGVLHDLLLHYSAVLSAKNQLEQERLRRSMSLLEVLQDPTLADDETVARIASNYRVDRKDGAAAGGAVTIVVSVLQDVTIAVGSVFEALGKTFITESVFTSRASSASIVSPTDRIMTSRGDGTYEFQIRVVAEEIGTASQLAKGTALVPTVPPPNFVAAIATEDFIGGLNQESNSELLARFAFGMASKSLSSRINMSAALREQFPDVLHDSIIGFGDEEMRRDRHSILPISYGGRVDWYVQTREIYRSYGGVKTAVLVEKTSDGRGIWRMEFAADEYPGLYEVSVRPLEGEALLGEFAIVSFLRGYDNIQVESEDDLVPDIANSSEAAFSPYQTATITFHDSQTATSELAENSSELDYAITVRAMPLLAEIQEFVANRSFRSTCGDVLIKAPIPCFVSLSFVVELTPGEKPPEIQPIIDDIVATVGRYGFLGRLPASRLLSVIHRHLTPQSSIADFDMTGRLLYPDGDFRIFRSSELLEIPDEPDRLVTGRTAMFFLDPADVAVSVVTADVLPVL